LNFLVFDPLKNNVAYIASRFPLLTPAVILAQADQAISILDYSSAKSLLVKYLENKPISPHATLSLINVYVKTFNYDQAITLAENLMLSSKDPYENLLGFLCTIIKNALKPEHIPICLVFDLFERYFLIMLEIEHLVN
jgi:predicted Zn-dependent protease